MKNAMMAARKAVGVMLANMVPASETFWMYLDWWKTLDGAIKRKERMDKAHE